MRTWRLPNPCLPANCQYPRLTANQRAHHGDRSLTPSLAPGQAGRLLLLADEGWTDE